jgi:hypothetical protein
MSTSLADIEKEFAAERAKLEEQYNKKRADALSKDKLALANAINNALTIYESIPESSRASVLDDGISELLGRFDPPDKKSGGRKERAPRAERGSNYTAEDVLTYISDPSVKQDDKTTGKIQAYFKSNSATLSKRINKLKATGAIKATKSGNRVFWEKA